MTYNDGFSVYAIGQGREETIYRIENKLAFVRPMLRLVRRPVAAHGHRDNHRNNLPTPKECTDQVVIPYRRHGCDKLNDGRQ